MAVAPPLHRELDLLVLSDLRLGSRYAQAERLLEQLSELQPRMLILLGSPLDPRLRDTDSLPHADRSVLHRFEAMARAGVRVFCLGRSWEDKSAGLRPGAIGPSGIQFRDELLLRLDGVRTLFVSTQVLRRNRRYDGLIDAVELVSRPVADGLRRRRDRAFAKTLGTLVDDRCAEAVVLPLWPGKPTVELGAVSVAWSGSWVRHGSVLEYLLGRWSLRSVRAAVELPVASAVQRPGRSTLGLGRLGLGVG